MRNHLKGKHEKIYKQLIADEEKLKSNYLQPTLKEVYQKVTIYSKSHPRAVEITKSIGQMIALDFQPYSIVEDIGFRNLLHVLKPRYHIPSRTTFSRSVIPQLYDYMQEEIKKEIAEKSEIVESNISLESISFTTDFWRSKTGDNYLSLTSYFLNKDFEPSIYTFACMPYYKQHSASNIRETLKKLIGAFFPVERIFGKIPIYIATDNAPNMVKAIQDEPTWEHISCFCHTLQLCVDDGLKIITVNGLKLSVILAKCRGIVGHFKRSGPSSILLNTAQEERGLRVKHLIQDVSTRWNSTYFMLQRIWELREVVTRVSLEIENLEIITSSEWKVLKGLMDILEPFEVATTDLSADHYPTISMIFPALHCINNELLRLALIPEHSCQGIVNEYLKNLKNRFKDYRNNDLYLMAMALDPRF